MRDIGTTRTRPASAPPLWRVKGILQRGGEIPDVAVVDRQQRIGLTGEDIDVECLDQARSGCRGSAGRPATSKRCGRDPRRSCRRRRRRAARPWPDLRPRRSAGTTTCACRARVGRDGSRLGDGTDAIQSRRSAPELRRFAPAGTAMPAAAAIAPSGVHGAQGCRAVHGRIDGVVHFEDRAEDLRHHLPDVGVGEIQRISPAAPSAVAGPAGVSGVPNDICGGAVACGEPTLPLVRSGAAAVSPGNGGRVVTTGVLGFAQPASPAASSRASRRRAARDRTRFVAAPCSGREGRTSVLGIIVAGLIRRAARLAELPSGPPVSGLPAWGSPASPTRAMTRSSGAGCGGRLAR